MNTEIIVAILAFVGTLAGSYFSNNKTTAVIQEQIKNIKEDISILSNRVDKHNNLISRMSVVEEKIKELENKGEREMLDLSVISNYLVVAVILVCCCIGYVIKTSLDFIPNKYIPLIMACIGVVLNYFIAGYFNVNVLLGGMLSGLSSVGLHQAFKNLIENKEGDK